MAGGSKTAVVAAIGGNAIVAVAKFVAFAFTGSGSMLSEGVHSVADVLNQVLLLVGVVRADKEPDELAHYGYVRERYIWALMSAVGIFFLGCGVTVYHGIHSLLDPPTEFGHLTWAFGVLGFSLLVEGTVLVMAFRAIKKSAGDTPFFAYIKDEADPSAVAVLAEDSAACLGILIALASIVLARVTGAVYWDAIGSITIGLLLGAIAIWLIVRNHKLLVGPAVPDEIAAKVRKVLEEAPSVEEIATFKSRMLDGETYDFTVEIEFHGKVIAKQLEHKVDAAWPNIDTLEDFKQFSEQYADEVVDALGDKINELEERVRTRVPGAKHLDIETN